MNKNAIMKLNNPAMHIKYPILTNSVSPLRSTNLKNKWQRKKKPTKDPETKISDDPHSLCSFASSNSEADSMAMNAVHVVRYPLYRWITLKYLLRLECGSGRRYPMIGCMNVKLSAIIPMRVCGLVLIFSKLNGVSPRPINIINADTIVREKVIDMHTRWIWNQYNPECSGYLVLVYPAVNVPISAKNIQLITIMAPCTLTRIS